MFEQLSELSRTVGAWSNPDLDSVGHAALVIILSVSLLSALLISMLYIRFYRGRESGSHIHRAFPLLGLSITAIFICVQFSLPLSLGLLGALSIVRFRTPVKEPEEIGFLMLVIASSLACATFNFQLLGFLMLVAVCGLLLALVAFRFQHARHSGALIVSLAREEYANKSGALLGWLARTFPSGQLESLVHSDGQVVVTYAFPELRPEKVAGLQNDLEEIVEPGDVTLLFHRGA
jgi:hypothetical protein